ncbi:MAG: FecR family protein [bacterium]|jgi:hypothetical protein|nr:FecR family protein [bacterium]
MKKQDPTSTSFHPSQPESQEDREIKLLLQAVQPDYTRLGDAVSRRIRQEAMGRTPQRVREPGWSLFSAPRWQYACGALLVLLLVAGISFLPSPQPLGIQIVSVDLKVASSPIQLDARIHKGQKIQSAASERTSLLLSDQSLVRLDEESALTLVGHRRMQFHQGRLFVDVRRMDDAARFVVETPNAVLTVLGTSFEVIYLDGQTTVNVLSGVVRVASKEDTAQMTDVAAEHRAVVSQTGLPLQATRASLRQPDWIRQLLAGEEKNPIIQSMKKHFPSRSLDLRN